MAIFTNRATLSYNGLSVNSNTVTGNLLEVLDISKTAVRNSYSPDGEVTYVISIRNSGTTAFTGLTVTDTLGAYEFGTNPATPLTPLDYLPDSLVYYQNGVLQTTPTPTDTDPLTITGITVPAGGNVILVYEVRANEFAPLAAQSTITNTATLTGGGLATPVTDTETITVSDEPSLSITKSLTPTTVTENSEITYTFTIQNTGNAPANAGDGITINDTFNPTLSNISVSVNGTTLPANEYTYDETTGEFATTPGSITVPEATYVQNPDTGAWTVTPGVTTVTVTGTI